MCVERGLRVVDGGAGEDVRVWRSAFCDVRDIVLVTIKGSLPSYVVELM